MEKVKCTQCKKIIDWSGDCDCKAPYAPMTTMEYRARFTYPFMRKNMKQLNGTDQVKH